MTGCGLEVLRSACFCRFGGFFLLALEVFDIRLAQSAADGFDVEVDVFGRLFVKDAEQVAADVIAGGAGEAMAPPNLANAMQAGVAAGVDRGKLFEQVGFFSELGLDRGHLLGGQGLV
jgi:hypothetical protein